MITMSINVLWICQMALMFYSQNILASGETTGEIRQSTTSAIDSSNTVQTTMLTTATTTTTTTKMMTSTSTKPSTTQLESFVTCRASGDPHFTTFDGAYFSPQEPSGKSFLAAEPVTAPNGTIPWSVWFNTSDCNKPRGVTCILQVEIDIEDQVVVFGNNGYFRVNSLNVIAPWYYPSKGNATVWVVNYGSAGHTLNSINRDVSVTFDGVYSMQIQIPLNLYFNETQGVCGNSNSNPNDDASCPDGGNMDTCWERYPNSTVSPTTAHTVQPYTATTTKTASRATCDNKTQQEINLQCAIITNKVGPFAACAVKAAELAIEYYLSCSYDLCYATNASDAICTLLQSFADVCMQVIPNTILQWRSANFCPQICPKNSHYETCASSCPATCSDTNAPANCKFPCHGDCTCDSSFIQDKGVCIRPELCGCRDSADYYHQSNSTWVTNDCKEICSCGANYTVNCLTNIPCNFHATCAVQDGKRNCYYLNGYPADGEICQSITSTTNVATTTKPTTTDLYRLYIGGDHFYTASYEEASHAISYVGYKSEGTLGKIVPQPTDPSCSTLTPIYRMYNGRDHFYTSSNAEALNAATLGYHSEGITGYCSSTLGACDANVPVYRFYFKSGDHFYTTSEYESNKVKDGCCGQVTYEGVMCYIWH